MKKQVIMSLFAAFAMVLNVNAQNDLQDNTYNMVLELANGTKLTIGPHEIKNISFFDGEVVVSGTRLDDLLKKLADVRVWTIGEDGYWYKDGVKTEINAKGNDGEPGKDGTEWTIDEDGYWCVDGEQTEYKAVAEGGSSEGIDELKEHVDKLETDIDDGLHSLKWLMEDNLDAQKANDAKLQDEINALETYVKELEKRVDYMEKEQEKKIAYLQERTDRKTQILLDILKSKGLFPEDQNPFGDD